MAEAEKFVLGKGPRLRAAIRFNDLCRLIRPINIFAHAKLMG